MYLKCCLTGLRNSELSLHTTMPSIIKKQVNEKAMLTPSWRKPKCSASGSSISSPVPGSCVREQLSFCGPLDSCLFHY